MSAITILVPNEIQGLQAFQDGHWYDVNYTPNDLAIYIGDQIEVLTLSLLLFNVENYLFSHMTIFFN